jgi:hypothetical protein
LIDPELSIAQLASHATRTLFHTQCVDPGATSRVRNSRKENLSQNGFLVPNLEEVGYKDSTVG